jgi:hypothetical protein
MRGERTEYLAALTKQFEGGSLSQTQLLKAMADYDAAAATKRLPLYALLSTIAAAASAIASAVSVFFAYLGSRH